MGLVKELMLKSRLGLGLLILANLGLVGCGMMTGSVKAQCDAVNQVSRDFGQYSSESSEIDGKAIQQYIPEALAEAINQGKKLTIEEAQALTSEMTNAVETDKSKLHADQAIAHKEFAKRLKQQRKATQKIKVSDKEVKYWRDMIFSFYDGYYRYHSQSSKLFQKMSQQGEDFDLKDPKTKALNDEINELKAWINDRTASEIRAKYFTKFQKYCEIGPSIKLESIQ